jgi:hypothetical protein
MTTPLPESDGLFVFFTIAMMDGGRAWIVTRKIQAAFCANDNNF